MRSTESGNQSLMMLLSLNLLVLVFFLLLNSMATLHEDRPHREMAKPQEGVPLNTPVNAEGDRVPLAPLAAWQESVLERLRGTILNRVDLEVLPQAANAGLVQVEIPLERMFTASGALRKPELVRQLREAAGPESTLSWQLVSQQDTPTTWPRLLTLTRATGQTVALVQGAGDVLRVTVRPGVATPPSRGILLQNIGAEAGAQVQGVKEIMP